MNTLHVESFPSTPEQVGTEAKHLMDDLSDLSRNIDFHDQEVINTRQGISQALKGGAKERDLGISRWRTSQTQRKSLANSLRDERRATYHAIFEHYANNSDSYHALALDEAAAAGVEIIFSGDVATKVHPI